MTARRRFIKTIHDVGEIPSFASEADEAAFWSTHSPATTLRRQAAPFPRHLLAPGPRPMRSRAGRPVTIKLDAATLHRLRTVAARKRIGERALLTHIITGHLRQAATRR